MEYKKNDTFTDKNWKETKRTPVQTWTRVMGYMRPIQSANIWKRSEFYSRKYFNESECKDDNVILMKRANADFVEQFS
jgi:hypothetical protein